MLKPFQNKKGQKKIEVPNKKAVFFLRKELFFCRVPRIFFNPSYYEPALETLRSEILFILGHCAKRHLKN